MNKTIIFGSLDFQFCKDTEVQTVVGPDYSFPKSPKMPSIHFVIFPFNYYKNDHISYQYEVNTGFLQEALDTVHVTNFVQSRLCRWRTDSFTFVRVVSSIFFDFRRLSSDLQLFFGKVWVDRCSKPQFLKQYNVCLFSIAWAFQVSLRLL